MVPKKVRKKRIYAGKLGGNPNFSDGKRNPYYNKHKDKQIDKRKHKQKIRSSSSSSSSVSSSEEQRISDPPPPQEKSSENPSPLQAPALPVTPMAPIPKKDSDVHHLVRAWKITCGVHKDDKPWDRINFARCALAAKNLLAAMGGDKTMAADCMVEIYENLTKKGLTVTLETVCRHAHEWRNLNGKRQTQPA